MHKRYNSPRIPANIPYVVDNIWEYLRPENMPSRRHSVYASPTPELALKNASGIAVDREEYVVCEIIYKSSDLKIAQLEVSDAREHPDITRLSKRVNSFIRNTYIDADWDLRRKLAPLLTPALRRSELQEIMDAYGPLNNLITDAKGESTIWTEASTVISKDSDGEIFFELVENANYLMHPINH